MISRNSRFSLKLVATCCGLTMFMFSGSSSAQTNTFPTTGNAGVGTVSPGQKVEVVTNTNSDGIKLNDGTVNSRWLVDTGSVAHGIGTVSSHPFYLFTGGSSRLWIASGGNVGIGNANPQSKLQVNGDIRVASGTGSIYFDTNSRLYSDSSYSILTDLDGNPRFYFAKAAGDSGNSYYDLGNNSGATHYFRSALGAGNLMVIKNNGNVGIGTTSPLDKLSVFGGIGVGYNSAMTTTDSGYINLRLGRLVSTPTNVADAYVAVQDTGGPGSAAGDLLLMPRSSVSASIRMFTGSTTPTERISILGNGNVGIGTTSPYSRLSNTTSNIVDNAGGGNGTLSSGLTWSVSGQGYAAAIQQADSSSNARNGLLVKTAATDTASYVFRAEGGSGGHHLIVRADGKVGIGTNTPSYKLDVNGDTNVQGNITASGSIAAKYQDVAEWVESSEQLAAGTVVVLDSTKSNQVTSSYVSYDTRVAGVISAQPGIALGEQGDNKVLVATTGRVKVKVDASKGPIRIGDLLVTSDVPGLAMKSEAVNLGGVQFHRPGTLIGKALEPLEKGKGEILVLLSLQ